MKTFKRKENVIVKDEHVTHPIYACVRVSAKTRETRGPRRAVVLCMNNHGENKGR